MSMNSAVLCLLLKIYFAPFVVFLPWILCSIIITELHYMYCQYPSRCCVIQSKKLLVFIALYIVTHSNFV